MREGEREGMRGGGREEGREGGGGGGESEMKEGINLQYGHFYISHSPYSTLYPLFLQVRCLVVSSTGSVITSKRVAYHTDSAHKVHEPCMFAHPHKNTHTYTSIHTHAFTTYTHTCTSSHIHNLHTCTHAHVHTACS